MSVEQRAAWAPHEIAAIAKWERFVVFLILIEIISELALLGMSMTSNPDSPSIATSIIVLLIVAARLVVVGLSIYGVYMMASALRKGTPVVWAICMIIPLIGLIVLLSLNSNAMTVLRAHGIGVGLMGAKQGDVERYLSQAQTLDFTR